MKTRTEQLTEKIRKIAKKHAAEIKALPTMTKRGNSNGANIKGWEHSPNGLITRACNLASVQTLPYWSGCLPTPATAIPSCIIDESQKEFDHIFG